MPQRLLCSALILILAAAPDIRAADRDAFGDPLPAGATARIGTIRYGPTGYMGCASLLPPRYETFLAIGQNGLFWQEAANGLFWHEATTGKLTAVPTREPIQPRHSAVVAESADGKRAVIAQLFHGSYVVIDIATGKTLQTIKSGSPSRDRASLSADGKVLALPGPPPPGNQGKIGVVVWDVDKNAELTRVAALPIRSVRTALSPDGKTLATFGEHHASDPIPADLTVRPERTVQLWEVASGKLLATLADTTCAGRSIPTAAFSPDGKTIAVSSGCGTIGLWEVPGGKLRDTLRGRTTAGAQLAFSPDGKTLAGVSGDGAVERWALPDGKPLKTTPSPLKSSRESLSRFSSCPLSGTGLAFADNDRVVVWGIVWSRMVAWEVPSARPEGIAPSGKLLTPFPHHLTAVQGLRFSENGREIISVGDEGHIVRGDTVSGKAKVVAVAGFNGHSVREGRAALGPVSARGLRGPLVFDPESGDELFQLPASHTIPSTDLTRALVPERGLDPKRDTTPCAIWNLDTRRKVSTIELPAVGDPLRVPREFSAAFSPDNSRLVTVIANMDLSQPADRVSFVVTGWDVKTGKKLGEFGEKAVHMTAELAAAHNNSGAVLATSDGRLWVADYEKGIRADTIDQVPAPVFAAPVFTCPTFSPDGKTFAVGLPTRKTDEFGVRIFAWPRGNALHTFTGHRGPITALAFSPDGKTLASGSTDATVLLWDLTALNKPK
jgi:WD40 repeat protein